jgi:hypothetical protein
VFINDEDDIECNYGTCKALDGDTGITSCIYCGGELIEVNGLWYHWTSFNSDGTLVDGAQVQDYVRGASKI